MSDYLHWHKVGDLPSACVIPPACCTDAIEKVQARKRDDAVHAERRRVILTATSAAATYGEAAASVLDDDRAGLVITAMTRMVEAIKRTGCICPLIDTGNFADYGATMRGYDRECGMHEVGT